MQHPTASAALDHRPCRGLGHEQVAREVEVEDAVELFRGVLLGRVERRAGAAADGVDDDVDPAEAG